MTTAAAEGTELQRESPQGRWSISVPVPEDERRHLYSDTARRPGQLFETARLRIFMLPGTRHHELRLSGLNIRQDGTPGAYTLRREIARTDVMRDYPRTWNAAVTALGELAARIRGDAETACAEIVLAFAEEREEKPAASNRTSVFFAKPDTGFAGSTALVEVTQNPGDDRNGRIVGWTTGPDAAEDAADVATILNETGHQPTEGGQARLHYTIKDGCDF
jgi:hypothetical protein